MEKRFNDVTYDELTSALLPYLDNGETIKALEYCKKVAENNNPYGYMFMGFIYEEGHGPIKIDYKKALICYEMAEEWGVDMSKEIMQVQKKLNALDEMLRKEQDQ